MGWHTQTCPDCGAVFQAYKNDTAKCPPCIKKDWYINKKFKEEYGIPLKYTQDEARIIDQMLNGTLPGPLGLYAMIILPDKGKLRKLYETQ